MPSKQNIAWHVAFDMPPKQNISWHVAFDMPLKQNILWHVTFDMAPKQTIGIIKLIKVLYSIVRINAENKPNITMLVSATTKFKCCAYANHSSIII